MSLARFYSRIHDAISPLLTGTEDLSTFLNEKLVSLIAPEDLENYPEHQAGFTLAVNLCARLYPKLRVLGPKRVVNECESIALQINPKCEFYKDKGAADGILAWASDDRSASEVIINPVGWDIHIDDAIGIRSSNVPVCLAAASIGVGELFRSVFADFLAEGRRKSAAHKLNLLTLNDSAVELPDLPTNVNLGPVHLAGAGAIGQAFVYTLARVSVTGTLVVVDPEELSVSNLQRYILAKDHDVGKSKCTLVARALQGSPLQTVCSRSRWGENDLTRGDDVEVVCAAVDTAAVRIGIQARLPRAIYNAWTQPADLGWSRHEHFGTDACLACLYWPSRARPSELQLIAQALAQPELRVLGYLADRVHVDQPLKPEQIRSLPGFVVPPEASSWCERPILEDILATFKIEDDDFTDWKGQELRDLYRDGICGGALIRGTHDDAHTDIMVPLAHQSSLAGVMLATQLLIANSPELRVFLPEATEARINVLRPFPQVIPRPRQRSPHCMCTDEDFLSRYQQKWKATPA